MTMYCEKDYKIDRTLNLKKVYFHYISKLPSIKPFVPFNIKIDVEKKIGETSK